MSNYIIVGGELYHYGVKGMKWGVRRAQKKINKLAKRGDIAGLEAIQKQAAQKSSAYYEKSSRSNSKNFRKSTKFFNKGMEFAKVSNLVSKKLDEIDPVRAEKARKFAEESRIQEKYNDAARQARKPSKYATDNKLFGSYSKEDQERIESYYDREISKATKKARSAKTDEERRRYTAEANVLEEERLWIYERD